MINIQLQMYLKNTHQSVDLLYLFNVGNTNVHVSAMSHHQLKQRNLHFCECRSFCSSKILACYCAPNTSFKICTCCRCFFPKPFLFFSAIYFLDYNVKVMGKHSTLTWIWVRLSLILLELIIYEFKYYDWCNNHICLVLLYLFFIFICFVCVVFTCDVLLLGTGAGGQQERKVSRGQAGGRSETL